MNTLVPLPYATSGADPVGLIGWVVDTFAVTDVQAAHALYGRVETVDVREPVDLDGPEVEG